jgi:hypothetical protein
MKRVDTPWTDSERELVFQFRMNGESAAIIAERFGRKPDGQLVRTRNSILSLIHRKMPGVAPSKLRKPSSMRVPPRQRNSAAVAHVTAKAQVREIPTAPVKQPAPATKPPVVTSLPESSMVGTGGVRFMDLGPNECRWPVGAVAGEHTFCGCAQFKGVPGNPNFGRSQYCLGHYRRSIQPDWLKKFETALSLAERRR